MLAGNDSGGAEKHEPSSGLARNALVKAYPGALFLHPICLEI